MDWLTIIGLIIFGTFLLIAEIIFVPGSTIIGILGFIFSVYGIYLGYDYFGSMTGSIIFGSTALINILAIVYAFKSKSWERFSLKGSNKSRVNDDYKIDLSLGQTGKTISSLKPIGKAQFGEDEVEVRSNGGFVEENVAIEIFRIESTKIFVKPINN